MVSSVALLHGFGLPVGVVPDFSYPKEQPEAMCFWQDLCIGVNQQCRRCSERIWASWLVWKHQHKGCCPLHAGSWVF